MANLTKETFEKLLSALDLDRDRAIAIYLNWYARLTTYFSVRQVTDAEHFVDQVFDTIAQKLEDENDIRNFGAYLFTIAGFKYRESLEKRARNVSTEVVPPSV